MTRYRKVIPSELHVGALVWVPWYAFTGITADDERVNDERVLCRVLLIGNPHAITVSAMASPLGRAPITDVGVSDIHVQLGADGLPTQPLSVQESPDKPRTQICYPEGIDMSRVGTPGQSAVLARPAKMQADRQSWQLVCPTCPLSQEGPPMVCAWGSRTPAGNFALVGSCQHSSGFRRLQDARADDLLSGCTFTGVPA